MTLVPSWLLTSTEPSWPTVALLPSLSLASTVLLPFVFAELPFPSLTSVDPSLLTFTEALESVEEDSLVTLLDDGAEDDESVLSLELPHAAKVNKARTETEAKVNLENVS